MPSASVCPSSRWSSWSCTVERERAGTMNSSSKSTVHSWRAWICSGRRIKRPFLLALSFSSTREEYYSSSLSFTTHSIWSTSWWVRPSSRWAPSSSLGTTGPMTHALPIWWKHSLRWAPSSSFTQWWPSLTSQILKQGTRVASHSWLSWASIFASTSSSCWGTLSKEWRLVAKLNAARGRLKRKSKTRSRMINNCQ